MMMLAALLTGCGGDPAVSSDAAGSSASESTSLQEGSQQNGVLQDGVYLADAVLSGGTGKASVESPCEVTVKDGQATAKITWSSSYYDYMIVDGETYYPVSTEGNSCFEIPVVPGEEMEVQADTTAMSQPHLIDYTLKLTLSEEPAGAASAEGREDEAETEEDGSAEKGELPGPPEIAGLTFVSEMEKDYAEDFAVFYYEDGYKVLAASSGREYLVVPEDGSVPEVLPKGMTVIQEPADGIYLAASSAMALFHALDALDVIAFSGTEADGWYIEDARAAMEAGEIRFAGKYSQPDYEGLLAGGCDLAVESTMILHTPEVQEKLEDLGIPVLIDESSHESHPLGRTEWIRFYGALLDKEAEADAFFESQKQILTEMENEEQTGKTVAFFFVNSAGNVVVRKGDDYIPKMISLAGGTYAFEGLENPNPESTSGSVTLSVEEFYAKAKDCDYLIYNAAIDNPLNSLSELLDKGRVFADFKAVKEGRVYTTDKYMYQATDIIGELIRDIHKMLTEEEPSDMLFLKHIEE